MVHEAHAHFRRQAIDGAEITVDLVRALLVADVVFRHDSRVKRHGNCNDNNGPCLKYDKRRVAID